MQNLKNQDLCELTIFQVGCFRYDQISPIPLAIRADIPVLMFALSGG